MKVFVTGATGFLGQRVVLEALRAGYEVRAVVRPMAEIPVPRENLEIVRLDLRQRDGLAEALRGCDAVIHLAAARSGDFFDRFAGTVSATENLLAAMKEAGLSHIVLVSSLAVYDYLHIPQGATLNEDSPIDQRMIDRDDEAHTKMLQERLVRQWAQEHRWAWTILRPGVIFGPGRVMCERLGIAMGEHWWFRLGSWAPIPLTFVDNCAEAIVLAVAHSEALGETINVIDDDPPSQLRYGAMLRDRMRPPPRIVPVSWLILQSGAFLVWEANGHLLGGRAILPELLIPARLHARCKPLRYDNSLAKRLLGWTPRYSLHQALDQSIRPQTD